MVKDIKEALKDKSLWENGFCLSDKRFAKARVRIVDDKTLRTGREYYLVLVMFYPSESASDSTFCFDSDGNCASDDTLKLILKPVKRTTTVWFNAYEGRALAHDSLRDANTARVSHCTATFSREIEWEDGEGLQ